MQKVLSCFIIIAVIAMLAPLCAHATTVFDSPISVGTYYGSNASANGGWTITREGDNQTGIEIGLRAKLRFPATPEIIDSVNNEYNVPTGIQDVSQTANPKLLAMWNYDFSISTWGNLNITTLTALLTIKDVDSPLSFLVLHPLAFGDNSGKIFTPISGTWGTNTIIPNLNGYVVPATATLYSVQNSENAVFASLMPAGFSAFEGGKHYEFNLTVSGTTTSNTTVTATDTILVNTVSPEPTSFLLFGGGLVLVGAYRRKKSKSS